MTEEVRNKKGQFVKGVSGNPNGKPRGANRHANVVKYCRERGYNPFEKLIDMTEEIEHRRSVLEHAESDKARRMMLDRNESRTELCRLESDIHKYIGKFLAPQLKSIELAAEEQAPVKVVLNLNDAKRFEDSVQDALSEYKEYKESDLNEKK